MVEERSEEEKKNEDGILKSTINELRRRVRAGCTKKMLYRRLPFLRWLPTYNSHDAFGDLVAGITVGLTVIPQSLAYSNVAGLPAQVRFYIFNHFSSGLIIFQ